MSTTTTPTERILAAQNLIEPHLHLIRDKSRLMMFCGKQLGGYWYGTIPASDVRTNAHGICAECKAAYLREEEKQA